MLFINACASKTGHQVATGNAIEQQENVGINKGELPPDFTITTIDGKQYRLSQFKEENKPILLYFWASWCPFCSRDFDVVKNIYPKYADKVTFLAIDLDLNEDKELISKYKEKKGISGIDFAEGKTDILSDYAIKYTTTKYAIARNGLILYKGSGVFNEQQWEVLFNALVSS
ncbi:TlpA family protein disulfide reductase [Candidatus Woesearchaeota archaeon]|nr:TlpA family protein disulfide reductase [Candidatus Woesearchaeota archaeon]